MSAQANSLKSIIYALSANFAITVAKGFAAFFTGSGAMMAETIHSLADTGNQVLLLWGLKTAKKAPSDDHPLGFGKEIYFWSFIVALMLFTLGGAFSMYEGFHKLSHPEALSFPWLALGVLIFAIIAEGISFWGCVNEVNKVRQNRSLWQWFKDSRQSALLVVFGEDFAALIGLVVASIAIVLTMITGNPLFDAIGSIIIGCLLIVIAFLVGVEIKALLIGQGVEQSVKQKMLHFLHEQPQVKQVYNLITLQMGDDVMVAIKAKMVACGGDSDLIGNINQVEEKLKAEFPEILWSFFEPDNHD